MVIGKLHVQNGTAAALAAVITLIVVAYMVIIPTVVANHYLGRLDERSAIAIDRLNKLSSGPDMAIFNDPDVRLDKHDVLIDRAAQEVQNARWALDDLEQANKLSQLPGNGFAGDYHRAIVRQERSANAIRQTKEVLDQYDGLLRYVNTYADPQTNLENHLNGINRIRDFNRLIGEGRGMAAIATRLRADSRALASLEAPAGFEQHKAESVTTFTKAANGFERLASGLNRGSDQQTYSAVAELERVTAKTQDDRNLFVDLAADSPILLQLAELPEKVEHAQGR